MQAEKNEIAKSIRGLGHRIKAVVSCENQASIPNGFSEVDCFRPAIQGWAHKVLYHLKMLYVALFDHYDIALFSVHSAHLIPFLKISFLFRTRKPLLILDIRTIPVDLVNDLRSKLELFRYNASIKIADLFCDGITCITPMLGSSLKPKLRKLRKKMGYFQTGVNFSLFDPSKSNSLKKSLKVEDRFIIFYHGVLSPNRGIQDVIKAVDICKEQIPNILFMVVGTGNGESELKKLTEDLKLAKHVMFTGAVPFEKIPSYIKTADLGIIPLPSIGWWNVSSPIKLKEYLAMQLAVVATDIPAHRLVIEKTGGATLVDNHDSRSFAKAILTFSETHQTAYPAKSRKALYECISFNSQMKQFLEYVRDLKN